MAGREPTRGLTDKPKGEELEGTAVPVLPGVGATRVVSLGLGAITAEAAAAALAKANLPDVGVVLPAGGQGLRVGGPEPKQFAALRPGRQMLVYALETFHGLPCVKQIALVLPPERLDTFRSLTEKFPKLRLCAGGAERFQSVLNGAASLDASLPYVAVHDVARPFVSEAVIRRCLEAAAPDACVLAALPATDTVKAVDGSRVERTLDRARLVLAQTPQVVSRSMLSALAAADWAAKGPAPTDEASMAEMLGFAVKWVRGSDLNRKVTGPADLAWARWLAERLDAGEALGGPDD